MMINFLQAQLLNRFQNIYHKTFIVIFKKLCTLEIN